MLPLADRISVDEVCYRWRMINNRIRTRCPEITSSLAVWGDNARTPGQRNLLRMDLLRESIDRYWDNLTVIDFWHPNAAEIPPPPNTYKRSELLNVPHEAIAALTQHCEHLEDLSLCTCVVPFNEDDLKLLLSHSNRIKFVAIRANLTSYDFFQNLNWRHVTVIRLDLPTMDFPILIRNLARFRYLRVLCINFPGQEVSRDLIPIGWASCRYEINLGVDVRAACQ